jgi:nitroreductase
MELKDLVKRSRSYRRFDQSIPITNGTLRELIDFARICPSTMNAQPLCYLLSCESEMNGRIFTTLSWAGSIKEWNGPEPGEQPTGYVVVLIKGASHQYTGYDIGIACQTMLLAAVDRGLGGCIIASVQREKLAQIMGVPEGHTIALVVALGTPAERIVLEDIPAGESTTYYREPDGTHHVPKRKLEDVIIKSFGEAYGES